MQLEPVIRGKVEKLCKRFEAIAKNQEVVRLDVAFMALTIDVITDYAFAADRKYLDEPDFQLLWFETIRGGFQNLALVLFFPWMLPAMKALPLSVAAAVNPTVGYMLRWQAGVKETVKDILKRKDDTSMKGEKGRTVFHELRDHPNLPDEEKTLQRLCDEGEIMTGAGSETTAQTLTKLAFYLKHEPRTLEYLRAELDKALPDPKVILPWAELQQLPYLVGSNCAANKSLSAVLTYL
jgi:cytochrome P450